MSSDFERRLADSLAPAFAQVEVPPGILSTVRRRHRRRLAYTTIASVAAVAGVVTGIAYAVRGFAPAPLNPTAPASQGEFPGGGRLLLLDGQGLTWANSDGTVTRIGGGYSGAQISGASILAWKPAGDSLEYYLTNLDGGNAQLVLPTAPSGATDTNLSLSPDGSRLAFVREVESPEGKVTDTLWVRDLASGQQSAVHDVSRNPLTWLDGHTILASSADVRDLIAIDAATGRAETYLSTTAPAITTAYEQARPSGGPPRFIHADGWASQPQSSELAVSIAGQNAAGNFSAPIEALVQGGRVVQVVAVQTPQQLDFAWGPGGTFVVQTGAGDNPMSWHAFLGRTGSSDVSGPIQSDGNSAAVGPDGRHVAVQQDGAIEVAAPADCDGSSSCTETRVQQSGVLVGWAG